MAKKSSGSSTQKGGIVNRRARFDYELGEPITAGLALTGPEVRAARDGHIQLKGAFVSFKDAELWLNNASFSLKLNERGDASARSVDTRPRKLLVRRKQLDALAQAKQRGMTIVPLKLLTNGRFIKVIIAPGKGKKHYDKRQALKKRTEERDIRRSH